MNENKNSVDNKVIFCFLILSLVCIKFLKNAISLKEITLWKLFLKVWDSSYCKLERNRIKLYIVKACGISIPEECKKGN